MSRDNHPLNTPQTRALFEEKHGAKPRNVEWRDAENSYCIRVPGRTVADEPIWTCCNEAFHFQQKYKAWVEGYAMGKPKPLTLTDIEVSHIANTFFERLHTISQKEPGFMLTAMREALSSIDAGMHGTEVDRLLWDANGGNHGSDTTTADAARRLTKERDDLRLQCGGMEMEINELKEAVKAVNTVKDDMRAQITTLSADKEAYGQNAINLRETLDELKARHQALIEANARPGKRHTMNSVMRAIEHAAIPVMTSNNAHKLAMALNYIAHDEVLEEGEPLPDETRLSVIEQLKQAQTLNDSLQKLTGQSSVAWHRHETIDDRIHDALEKLGD